MGITPNRSYPYPDPSSPADVAGDLQALAEAYDTDLKAVEDGIQQRPFFRATASARQPYGTVDPPEVVFDVLEENRSNALLDGPGTSMPRTRFVPLIPGLWAFTATVSYPSWAGISWVRLQLLSNTEVASSVATEMPVSADGNRTISVTGMQEMSGTGTGTPMIVRFWASPAANRAVFPIFSRSLTGFLVSRT